MTQGKLIALGQPNSDIERTLRRRLRIVQLGKSGSIKVSVEVYQEPHMAENQCSLSNYARPNL